jgi:hypothetical protein
MGANVVATAPLIAFFLAAQGHDRQAEPQGALMPDPD